MVVPARWAPMPCNWHRVPVPTSLPRQAATMKRTSTPSEPAGLSIIERQFEKVLREKSHVVFAFIGADTHNPLKNVRGTHSDQAQCSIIAFALRAHDHALWAQIEAVVQQRSTGPATHLD